MAEIPAGRRLPQGGDAVNTYDADFYLVCRVVERGYAKLGARLATRRPSLGAGEACMRLTVSLPCALFERPALQARITVPEGSAPAAISAEVKANIADELSKQLGMRVEVTPAADVEFIG